MQPRHIRICLILFVFAVLIISNAGVKAWPNLALFTISGSVTSSVGQPVSGVTINLTGYQTATTQTSGTGAFGFSNLSPNGNYTVRPFMENFYFTPRAKVYNSLTQNEIANFVAHVCSYTLSSPGQSFAAAGGTGQVSLTANDAFCSWMATSNVPWMRITSSGSGNGNSLIRFTVDPSTTARSGALTIGGLSFVVNQTGCTYVLTPSQQSFSATGGMGAITVSALESFCPWTATSNVAWINVTSGSNGTGNGVVFYTVAPTTQSRRGILTIAGKIITVYEAAIDACQSLGFAPATSNAVGVQPYNMIVADLNADARDDVVTSNYTDISGQQSSYSVLLSNGDGTFSRSTTNLSGIAGPWGIGVGDFNDDAKPDLAISGGSGRIVILLNTGAGSFSQANSFDLSIFGGLLTTGDFDRDGKDDLAVLERNDDSLRIMRGNGNATFTPLGPLYLLTGRAYSLTKGDFNGDGFIDFAAISEEPFGVGRLYYLLGNGAGAFSAAVTVAIPSSFPYGLRAGDFNGDGRDDLVLTALATSQVAVLIWNANVNSFDAPVTYFTDAYVTGRLAVGDVNGDGKVDVVGAGGGSFVNKISVLLGNGDGTLAPALSVTFAYDSANGIDLGKFNGDGKLDLAISTGQNNDPGSVLVRLNVCTLVDSSGTPFDFDGDGKSDVAIYRPTTGFWYINESSNNALRATAFGQTNDRITPGDYDGDRRTDIAIFRPSTGFWYLLTSSDNSIHTTLLGQIDDVPMSGDFDGDGKADVAIYRPSNNTFNLLYSSDGSAHFQQWGQAGDLPVLGDYDGDSKTDFAIFRPSVGAFYILLSSNGTVQGQQFGQSGDKPITADFDGDGKTDIAIYRPSTGGWYMLNSSDNSFHGVAWGANGDIASAGDYDGDGKCDVAIFRPSTGAFYILQSTNNALRVDQFGTNGDVPIESAYVP